MTNRPTGPALWQHLVQWQPATAAALAEHARALPDDWPARVFGVARADAALALPPGATGEQFPDRAPEIAPYDEIAPLDDCPACKEAEGNCRFHEGYASGHHEALQAQLDAVRAHPRMGLREFMRWQADVEEAEDRGQEPPALPAPASVPAVVEPPTDHTETDEERADREATERDHARGDHTYCGVTCEAVFPSDMLRNTVLYRAIPGSQTMLAELERRAATEARTGDLPARLEAALTERYTELGNPFSEMRRQEKGPDGWPASHPVGPHHVAEALRELLATDDPQRCAHCTHPKRDHDGRADHRAKHSPLVAGDPWCHACNGPCDYAAGARQDGGAQ